MKQILKIMNSKAFAAEKEKIAKDHLLSICWMLVETRQILSSIRLVAASINRLPVSDHLLMMQMHDTLMEVRQTITNLNQAANDVNQTITDLNETLSVHYDIKNNERSETGNRYSLN